MTGRPVESSPPRPICFVSGTISGALSRARCRFAPAGAYQRPDVSRLYPKALALGKIAQRPQDVTLTKGERRVVLIVPISLEHLGESLTGGPV
jgi:hypothetical protein